MNAHKYFDPGQASALGPGSYNASIFIYLLYGSDIVAKAARLVSGYIQAQLAEDRTALPGLFLLSQGLLGCGPCWSGLRLKASLHKYGPQGAHKNNKANKANNYLLHKNHLAQ